MERAQAGVGEESDLFSVIRAVALTEDPGSETAEAKRQIRATHLRIVFLAFSETLEVPSAPKPTKLPEAEQNQSP